MKHIEPIKLRYIRIVIIVVLFANINIQHAKAQENRRFFTFDPITEIEYRSALKNNYNAPFVTEITDSIKREKAFESIGRTYSKSEKELAKRELLNSPRSLTTFKAYYPDHNLYLFYISDYHYEKASFIFASTNKLASGYLRYRGSYGVMSNDGLWVGLEREDCDNFLQLEICKSSKDGVWSLCRFEFTNIDINDDEETVMFWADKNTIYIATKEYDHRNDVVLKYYSIKFEY